MNTLPSAQFRKTYASLTEPTVVTVNGHAIGEWRPFTGAIVMSEADYKALDAVRPELRKDVDGRYVHSSTFNSRGSRPVPKK